MIINESGASRCRNSRAMLAAMVSIAFLALQPGQALAHSSSKNADPQKQASLQQKSSTFRKANRKVVTTGSPYVCTPSGFGRKGRCILRASLR